MPRNSQIDEQISSVLNEVTFKPSNILKINYSSSIKNNFDEINYENLSAELKINNLETSFDYSNQNDLNDNSYSNLIQLVLNLMIIIYLLKQEEIKKLI